MMNHRIPNAVRIAMLVAMALLTSVGLDTSAVAGNVVAENASHHPDVTGDEWWDGFDRSFAFTGGGILSLHPYAGGLIAVGGFSAIDDLPARHIAFWDGSAWHRLGDGIENTNPRALVEHAGSLIVTDVGRVLRWDGVNWTTLGGDTGTSDQIIALASYGGELFASYFASGVMRWTGTEWVSFATVQGPSTPKVSVLDEFGGSLIAAGRFESINSIPTRGIAAWNGSSWSALGIGMSTGSLVDELLVRGNELFALGNFTFAGGQPTNGFASWNGTSWTSRTGSVHQLTLWNDTIVGINSSNVVYRLVQEAWQSMGVHTAALASTGGVLYRANWTQELTVGDDVLRFEDPNWRPITPLVQGLGLERPIGPMVVYRDTLVVAGSGTMRLWDGEAWHPFPQPLSGIRAMRVFRGDLIVGGNFYSIPMGGGPANGIARWDGDSWHSLAGGVRDGLDPGEVYALTEYRGDLISGGSFQFDNGSDGVGRWDGVRWWPLASGPGLHNQAIRSLCVHEDQLMAVAPSCPCSGDCGGAVARWDGMTWTRLEGAGASNVASAGGELYVTDLQLRCDDWSELKFDFARWNGAYWEEMPAPDARNTQTLMVLRDHLAYGATLWNGSSWSPLGTGISGSVGGAAEYAGSLYFGGSFTSAGGHPSYYIARWDGGPTAIAVEAFEAQVVPGGVSLSWRLAASSLAPFEAVHVERANEASGPYATRTAQPLEARETMTFFDADAEASNGLWYRLRLFGHDGGELLTAPVEVLPAGSGNEFSLETPVIASGGDEVRILYRLAARSERVDLSIYNVRGRLVRCLVSGPANPGVHVHSWDRQTEAGVEVPRGIYFVRLHSNGISTARKLPLLSRE